MSGFEPCEVEFIKPGWVTLFGKVVQIYTIDQMTTIVFDTGDYMHVPDHTELHVKEN